VAGVPGRYVIELEPEVRDWLETLCLRDYAKVEAMADNHAETLGEPYSRHLGGKTRELRFRLERAAVRISYWLAPAMRVVLLTVFRRRGRSSGQRSLGRSQPRKHASSGTRITHRLTRSTSGSGAKR